jgi:4-amino-4-deoxychorismate lyase
MTLWIDGARQAASTTLDRGLEFGDGLFETMAVHGGRVRLLDRHLERLYAGAARLGIAAPADATLREEIARAAAEPGCGVLKLIVTRGAGGHGYRAESGPAPRRWLAALSPRTRPASWPQAGVVARICATRLAEQPLLAGLKHLNRLEQVLARREWSDPEVAEGLMLDVHGRLVCGTMSNVFLVVNGTVVTPLLARCGVAGVMRAAVLAALRAAGSAVAERDVDLAEVAAASEVFLSNALIGAWPVRRLEAWQGAPGPVVRRVQAWVEAW